MRRTRVGWGDGAGAKLSIFKQFVIKEAGHFLVMDRRLGAVVDEMAKWIASEVEVWRQLVRARGST
jgi:hypothetical protein